MAKTPLIPSKPLEKFDISKIGQGKSFTEGRYGGKLGNRRWGLKGQLAAYKRTGKFGETKNLSKKNVDEIYQLLSERLKKHQRASSALITRKDRIKIMSKSLKLRRTPGSKFTRVDQKDLRKIVSTFEQQSKGAIYNGKGNGGMSSKVKQSKIMDRLMEKNPQPETLANQNPVIKTAPAVQPTFASPLPDISKPANQQTSPAWQTSSPTSNDNFQPTYQPPTPAARPAEEPGQKSEPQDMQIG